MGVSLERVQFKFASIIGELCSEPDVLSQFAVWLDLRLAEYKLKGNISLDGFGDEPDPAWLKGLNKGKSKNLNYQTDLQTENMSPHTSAERVEPVQLTQNLVHSNALNFHSITMPMATVPGPSLMLQERLPVSVAVTIKKERNESLYSHCSAAKIFPTTPDMSSRKRTVPNFCVNSNQSTKGLQLPTCTQPKQRRLSLPTVTQSSGNQIPASASYDQGILNGRSGENSKRPTPIPMTTSPRLRSSLDSQSNQSNDHSENKEPNFTEDFYHDNGQAQAETSGGGNSSPMSSAQSEADETTYNEFIVGPPRSGRINVRKDAILSAMIENGVHSTARKTVSDIRLLKQFLLQIGEEREIYKIPANELSQILIKFFTNLKKCSGDDYVPDTLRTILSSIDRYLKRGGYRHALSCSMEFFRLRQTVKNKQMELRLQGLGNQPKKTDRMTAAEVERLWITGQFGSHSPSAIINTLWFYNTARLGLRSASDHRTLSWGDIKLRQDESGREYLELTKTLKKDKNRESKDGVACKKRMIWDVPSNPQRCPVQVYKVYKSERPQGYDEDSSPFYIATAQRWSEDPSFPFFRRQPVGINNIASLMKRMAQAANLSAQKRLTNSSVTKILRANP